MGKITALKNRIYNDYLMPSRMGEYERMIVALLENDYELITVRDYYEKLRKNNLGQQKYFINRHDIDTDLKTTKRFFEIEKKHNVKATYYFRRSTLDFSLMKKIEAFGSEASYHFEEIAQYCKDHHIKSKEEALQKMEDIRTVFKKNFTEIENKLGHKITTVCSHGDFVNRAIGLINNELTKDASLRESLGIACETYDPELFGSFDIYISDKQYPVFYKPINVFDAIGKHNIICLLTHPRQWHTNWYVNTHDNLKRVYEGWRW